MWQLLLVYLVPYLLVGYETIGEAVEGLLHGDAFNEHLLMTVATLGALAIGFLPNAEPEMAEAVFVMLFFQVGELFEGIAEGRSRRSIEELMSIRPDTATVVREGREQEVKAEEVAVGEEVVVRPGDRVPLDGVVVDGSSSLDKAALTGESVPCAVGVGDAVESGTINLSGVLRMRTSKSFGESTASRIIEMVEEAGEHKSSSETFIARFARVYTPIVVFAAVALALLPPLLSGAFAESFPVWLHRALVFLVVSCPCALVISVPLTFFGGIGAASRRGVLVKGANYLDALAKAETVVFDKTGTLTRGSFSVVAVHPEECDAERLLHLAAHVEHFSTHPIAAALREAFPEEATDGCTITCVEEVAGHGIRARVMDEEVHVGNAKMMESIGVEWHDCHQTGTIIHVAIDGRYAGHIVISDTVKPDSHEAIDELKRMGVTDIAMLSGDRQRVADEVARELGIGRCYAELLPADKLSILEEMLAKSGRRGSLLFVGDGINDAPALSRADIGVAMGGMGSGAAIEAADVVLMDDKTSKIAAAIDIARRTRRIANQNVWGAIGVKVAVLLLASVGVATMWMAVFADVGVTVLAVLNAMRMLAIRR